MKKEDFDFYDKTSLKSYNLDSSMRYQLNILDNLDNFTRKHSENVASITCRLCEYLRCNTNFIIYCTICAYLHDIGKSFITPSILQKPSKLTEEEYEVMKTHTTIGYKMCMDDLKLRPYCLGAKYHHEALDGSGYPEGLIGNTIPYEAQIIRVADEFDAISSKRQYKSHVGISDTVKMLIENSHSTLPNAKYGKINPIIIKALKKVVIDDIEYEISCTIDYLSYLKKQIKRLKQIDSFYNKMINCNKEKDKTGYKQGIIQFLEDGENLENYTEILKEYNEALVSRTQIIENLCQEVTNVKKLKI